MPENTSSEPVSTIHLSAKGCSGRAVKYKVLPPSMIAHIEGQASHALDDKSTAYEFNEKAVMMALEQMIVAVTEPVSRDRYAGKKAKPEDPEPRPLEWKQVTADALHNGWESFFNAKDTFVLKRVHGSEHAASKDEIDEIMAGKVTTVGG